MGKLKRKRRSWKCRNKKRKLRVFTCRHGSFYGCEWGGHKAQHPGCNPRVSTVRKFRAEQKSSLEAASTAMPQKTEEVKKKVDLAAQTIKKTINVIDSIRHSIKIRRERIASCLVDCNSLKAAGKEIQKNLKSKQSEAAALEEDLAKLRAKEKKILDGISSALK